MTRTADSLPDPLAYSVDGAAKAIGISADVLERIIARGHLTTFQTMPRGKRLLGADNVREFCRVNSTAAAVLRCAETLPALMQMETSPLVECGVYLLFYRGALAYVGRSTQLRARLSEHRRSGRLFDTEQVIACAPEIAQWLEAELIRTLQPPQNVIRYARRAAIAAKALSSTVAA